MRSAHPPLGEGNPVSLADLAADPVVLINLPHRRSYFLSLFQMSGVTPLMAVATASIEMLGAMVANGLGAGQLGRPTFCMIWPMIAGTWGVGADRSPALEARRHRARRDSAPNAATAAFLHVCVEPMGNLLVTL
ncbi:LysR substrate-binding domain-containing protein [Paracoccus sp. WLY502]|uniref:LysR substrate-binding domain-containing protein n=1 Tax=Paracoccus yibinensis TaxID=3068891 RepID=UPI0027967A29|nr:LysR substrate-binding domain-containing protein [Paracoccus sp. WLY502]MDQ1901611.1 LysR substrate-binding domain-containing protein [Paracoccus sp. WLY502]